MKTNALAVANYFIDLSIRDNKPIHLLGLIKRVYIAHGFSLALLNHGLLDPRFDKVEAWKYGPVIPSVYHSFKQYKAEAIKEHTSILYQKGDETPNFEEPVLTDDKSKMIVEMVWKRYLNYEDTQLVALTHRPGTPWGACYIPNENQEIPDSFTKLFYSKLVKVIIDKKNNA